MNLKNPSRGGSSKDLEKRRNWQQAEVAKSKVFSSGSMFDFAGLVESLFNRGHVRTLCAEYDDPHPVRKSITEATAVTRYRNGAISYGVDCDSRKTSLCPDAKA